MFEATTISSHFHVDSQALDEVRSLVFLVAAGLHSARQLSAHQSSRLLMKFMLLFQDDTPDMMVHMH